jgi:two-component system sensor histidine kinase ChiS
VIARFSIVLLFLVTCHFGISSIAQQARKGKVDARSFSFDGKKPFVLSGQWEFYWNQLLLPGDSLHFINPEFVQVPGSWHRFTEHPALGFGTYRLIAYVDPMQRDMLLYFPVVNASAKVWLNGELVLENGMVSSVKESYQPKLSSFMLTVPEKTEKIEILLQVANFSYFSGGMGGTPLLDRAANHLTRINRLNGVENFFAGSLIAMFIYQLILFFLYDKGKPYLWLGLICLGVALRALIVHGGSLLLPSLFHTPGWEFWKKLEFGSVYAIVSFFPLYIFHLFPQHAPRWPLMFLVGLSGLLCSTVIVTPQYIYGNLLELCHLGLLLSFVYAIYSITKAWRAGEEDARIILWGVLASFPFILLEILKNSRLYPVDINFMYLVELGVLVFLLFQVYLLSNHYAKAYKNLEKLVEERTRDLTTSNSVRERLLSVVSHDMKSPLNSLRGILNLFNRSIITNEEFVKFTKHVESDLNRTGMLVENILHWTNSQLKGINVQRETFNLHLLVHENVMLAQTTGSLKKISIQHNVPVDLFVNTDKNILHMALRNLLANALKFSNESGVIQIHQEVTNEFLQLSIIDHGVGMSEQTLQELQQVNTTISKVGTGKEHGTGLGLAICREYLSTAGGTLQIESKIGIGSTFMIILPLGSDPTLLDN